MTILGDRADWEVVLRKAEKLKTFGNEPAKFYHLLRPILERFVRSFNEPNSGATIHFW